LPADLYARLEAFAEQYRYHRGDPPLAVCVREMVTFCLDHADIFRQPIISTTPPVDHGESFRQSKTPRSTAAQERSEYSRQPRNVPLPSAGPGDTFRQPKNNPKQVVQWHHIDDRQPVNIPVASECPRDIYRLSENLTSPALQGHRTHYRQPENTPTFDTTRFFLGELCSEAHRYQGQEHSLRYLSGDQNCVTCRRERNRRYNAAKRERQVWRTTTPQRS
jgi:hypothetical protein